jgi:hypothetical protein
MLLHLLGIRYSFLVGLLDPLFYDLVHYGTGDRLFKRLCLGALLLNDLNHFVSELSWTLRFQANKTSEALPFVPDNYDLGDDGQGLRDLVFDDNWRNVLAACRDDELFNASSYEDVVIGVQLALIS